MVALADAHGIPVRSAASLAVGDQTIPVRGELSALVPEGGLLRGRVLSCSGPAARSLALALVAEAVATGRWLALVDLEDLPAEALVEADVPLHRVVSVSAGSSVADALTAVLDGFELVILGSGPLPGGLARRVAQRVRSRGTVLLTIAGSGGDVTFADIAFATSDPVWSGIGRGTGRLVSRTVRVERSGRRSPRPIALELCLPAPSGPFVDSEGVAAPMHRLRVV